MTKEMLTNLVSSTVLRKSQTSLQVLTEWNSAFNSTLEDIFTEKRNPANTEPQLQHRSTA